MPPPAATGNKATFRRFQESTNTHDPELISRTIDEIVDADVLIRTPLPVQSTGAQALKEVFARLHGAFPDLHVTVEDLIEEGDKVVGPNTGYRAASRRILPSETARRHPRGFGMRQNSRARNVRSRCH